MRRITATTPLRATDRPRHDAFLELKRVAQPTEPTWMRIVSLAVRPSALVTVTVMWWLMGEVAPSLRVRSNVAPVPSGPS